MPVIRDIMRALVKEYGKEKAKDVYYGLENSGKLDKAKKTIEGRKK